VSQPSVLEARYRDLQSYVRWTDEDARRLAAVAERVAPSFAACIDDFYAEIDRHGEARKVITGGEAQVERLKQSLLRWLTDLFSGRYDGEYLQRRWQVGRRHVEIGLDQVYTNVSLSRLKCRLLAQIWERGPDDAGERLRTMESLNKLLDLDLAIIEDAYQSEYLAREQRVQRLVAIGQVAGGIAHELRNPLNVVKTSVYYLLHARALSPEKTAEHLQRIERQVGRADGAITALADFARLPTPDVKPLSIRKCLEEILEGDPLPATIAVSVDCPAEGLAVAGDARQLAIVFANLIRNARDAMPAGGRLTISARRAVPQVEIAFTDTGIGMQPAELARITEPLYSTKVHGLGLGLAISRAILDKHQGALQVTSAPGEGSTFTVRLPTATGSAEGASDESQFRPSGRR
jgi:signal transduction histidine kinase